MDPSTTTDPQDPQVADPQPTTTRDVTGWLGVVLTHKGFQYAWPFVIIVIMFNGVFCGASWLANSKTAHWHTERHPGLYEELNPEPYPAEFLSRHVTTGRKVEKDCNTHFGKFDPETYKGACLRLGEQAEKASARAEHHFWIARFYNVRYFACLLTAFWMGTLAAGGSLAVSRKGWENADPRVLSATATLILGTALYGGLPRLLMMSDNIADNASTYMAYDNLLFDIETFALVGKSAGGIVEPAEFVHAVDKVLAETNGIHIRFNEEAVEAGAQQLRAQQPE